VVSAHRMAVASKYADRFNEANRGSWWQKRVFEGDVELSPSGEPTSMDAATTEFVRLIEGYNAHLVAEIAKLGRNPTPAELDTIEEEYFRAFRQKLGQEELLNFIHSKGATQAIRDTYERSGAEAAMNTGSELGVVIRDNQGLLDRIRERGN
jgi:hypothetical protein